MKNQTKVKIQRTIQKLKGRITDDELSCVIFSHFYIQNEIDNIGKETCGVELSVDNISKYLGIKLSNETKIGISKIIYIRSEILNYEDFCEWLSEKFNEICIKKHDLLQYV